MMEMDKGPEEDGGSLCRRKVSEVGTGECRGIFYPENLVPVGEKNEGPEATVSIIRVCKGGANDHARKCGLQGQGKCRSKLWRNGN